VRKLLFVAGIAAATLPFGASGAVQADDLPAGTQGCVATSPGANAPAALYNGTCSFTAARNGGYVAGAQNWTVTVYNNNSATKVVVASFSGSGPGCNTFAYATGNFVVATASNGEIAVGNPIPAAADSTLPPSSNRCP
jgi:hypothetical protein